MPKKYGITRGTKRGLAPGLRCGVFKYSIMSFPIFHAPTDSIMHGAPMVDLSETNKQYARL